jgi:hypothetical protein
MIRLGPDPRNIRPLFLWEMGSQPLPFQPFPATDRYPLSILAGTPRGTPPLTAGVDRTPDGLTWVLAPSYDGQLVLHTYGPNSEPIASRTAVDSWETSARLAELPGLAASIPLHVRSGAAYVGFGDRLIVLKGNDKPRDVEMPGVIYGLCGSPPHSTVRIVAALEQGAAMFWDDAGSGRLERFASDLPHPVVTFTRSGWLAAAAEGVCEVYRTQGWNLRQHATTSDAPIHPRAVLPCADADQFAIASVEGILRVYRMPRMG